MTKTSYGSTPVFTEQSLPASLQSNHSLKSGTWGKLNLLSGSLRYTIVETGEQSLLKAGDCQIIPPEQLHFVEPLGTMTMRVDFYHQRPE